MTAFFLYTLELLPGLPTGLPKQGQGSFLNWPPPTSALQNADEGIRALVDSHQRQVQAELDAAESPVPSHKKKRNRWEPRTLARRQTNTAQEAVMAEPIFSRVLESDKVIVSILSPNKCLVL